MPASDAVSTPGPSNPKRAATIQGVQRAAAVLAAFTVSRPHLTLNEITSLLGTSKATAHRYTKGLREARLLHFDERTSLYSLGRQALKLGSSARAGLPLIELSQSYLQDLAQRVNETAVLSIWDGDAPTVIGSVNASNRVVTVSILPGARLDATRSAQGRVFCAHLPPKHLRDLDEHLERQPTFRSALRDIREHGVCVNTPEVGGVHAIAAPVFIDGAIVACLAIVGTTSTVPRTRDHPTVEALLETARAMSRDLATPSNSLDTAIG